MTTSPCRSVKDVAPVTHLFAEFPSFQVWQDTALPLPLGDGATAQQHGWSQWQGRARGFLSAHDPDLLILD